MAVKASITKESKQLVLKGLDNATFKIWRSTEAGLTAAAEVIKAESIKMTPKDTGHLRNSAYVKPGFNALLGPYAEVGYTANYALQVHEINRAYNEGQWKFLETALRDNRARVFNILKAYARF